MVIRSLLTLVLLMVLTIAPMNAMSASPNKSDVPAGTAAIISKPTMGKKAGDKISEYMDGVCSTLKKNGITARTVRNGQVTEAVIPSSMLFMPNTPTLISGSIASLDFFAPLLKYPTMYRIEIVVHTDNTGDDQYRDTLSSERAEAIYHYLRTQSGTTAQNVHYRGMSDSEPIAPNNSLQQRNSNRRVAIYIVPESQMIEMANAGRLSY